MEPAVAKATVASPSTWSGVRPLPALLTLTIGLSLWWLPVPNGLSLQAWHLFAIFVATIVGLIVKPLPLAPTVLIGLVTALLTKTASFGDLFESYASPSIWLVISSFLIAQGLIKTRLANRIAYLLVSRIGKSPLGLAYGLVFSELILAPCIPSLAARSGGIIFPIALALAAQTSADSKSRTGRFILMAAFQGSVICSAMFITAAAGNPLAVGFAKELGVTISWGLWALAALLPGLLSLAITPWLLSKLYPPDLKSTPDAPALAKAKLLEMGRITRPEWIMIGVFTILLTLWMCGESLGINGATAGLLGLSLLLISGVLEWKDCLKETNAWDALFWLAALMALGTQLKKLGFFTWFSNQAVATIGTDLPWVWGFLLLTLCYFYAHYFFASNIAHVSAMLFAFLMAATTLGTPPLLAALTLSFLSSLFGGLTHYGSGSAPLFFGAGYASLKEWWIAGFLISLVNLLIWLTIGPLWWKLLGII